MANFCVGKWVILVDADEFLIYPDCEERPVAELVSEMEMQGFDAIRADMVDMYPLGDLEAADFSRNPPFTVAPWHDAVPLVPWHLGSGHFSNSPSFVSALRHRLLPNSEPHAFVGQKYAILKYAPWVRLSEGLHYAANVNPHPDPVWIAHFKYHAGFERKVQTEIRRGQHFQNAKEYVSTSEYQART